MAFDEGTSAGISAFCEKFYEKDDRETPDTLQVTYEYSGFLAVYAVVSLYRRDFTFCHAEEI
jgi:hypothetical protein